MDSLKTAALRGLSWTSAGRLSTEVLRFGFGVLLARLLSPREFGLVAMVVVFAGLANIFMELGLGAAIIQKQDLEERHVSSVFWLNLSAGVLLGLALALSSSWIAAFYHEPILRMVSVCLSFNFVFGALQVVQNALLCKRLSFKRIAIFEVTAIVLSGTAGVAMASKGFEVWSLVTYSVLYNAFLAALLWVGNSWRPRRWLDPAGLREIMGFSLNLLGHRFLDYCTMSLDQLLIGRVIGPSALGAYSKAYQLMLLPVRQVSAVVSRVMFPALSTIQEDRQRVQRIYLRAIRIISLVSFPLMTGLIVVARPFILALFGSQWEEAVPLLQVFCVVGMQQSVASTLGIIYLSQGRADWMFRWSVYAAIVKVTAIIIGLRWGALGVAISFTSASLIFLFYPGYAVAGKLVGMSFSAVAATLWEALAASAVMAAGVVGLGMLLPASGPPLLLLAGKVTLGVCIYWLIIHQFRAKGYMDLRDLIREHFGGGGERHA